MADNNGVIDAINHGITQITAAIAQAANNIQQPQQVQAGQFSRSPLQAHQGNPETSVNTTNSLPSHCSLMQKNSRWNQISSKHLSTYYFND